MALSVGSDKLSFTRERRRWGPILSLSATISSGPADPLSAGQLVKAEAVLVSG